MMLSVGSVARRRRDAIENVSTRLERLVTGRTAPDIPLLRTGEHEALSEDDLDLVEQNTGVRIERPEGVNAARRDRQNTC